MDAPTRAQKMRCGNEIGCAVRPRSGLFDIVKRKRGDGRCHRRPLHLDGVAHTYLEPRIAAQAPVSLGCTGGGRPGAKPVRTQSRFRSRYLLGRMVSSKACKFSRSCSGRTTAMINAESNEKRRTPRHAAARFVRIHPSVAWSRWPMDKEGDALRRGNIHVQLSIDV